MSDAGASAAASSSAGSAGLFFAAAGRSERASPVVRREVLLAGVKARQAEILGDVLDESIRRSAELREKREKARRERERVEERQRRAYEYAQAEAESARFLADRLAAEARDDRRDREREAGVQAPPAEPSTPAPPESPESPESPDVGPGPRDAQADAARRRADGLEATARGKAPLNAVA